jgi:hypothetical protein
MYANRYDGGRIPTAVAVDRTRKTRMERLA